MLYYIVAYSCCVSEKVELEAVTQLLLGGEGGGDLIMELAQHCINTLHFE